MCLLLLVVLVLLLVCFVLIGFVFVFIVWMVVVFGLDVVVLCGSVEVGNWYWLVFGFFVIDYVLFVFSVLLFSLLCELDV